MASHYARQTEVNCNTSASDSNKLSNISQLFPSSSTTTAAAAGSTGSGSRSQGSVTYSDDVEQLLSELEEVTNYPATPQIKRMISEWLRYISLDVISAAICDTALAPRPSVRYLVAIMNRLEREGVRTIEDWDKRSFDFEQKKEEQRRTRESNARDLWF